MGGFSSNPGESHGDMAMVEVVEVEVEQSIRLWS